MAVVISISVQLASPWLHPDDRKKIQAETLEYVVALERGAEKPDQIAIARLTAHLAKLRKSIQK